MAHDVLLGRGGRLLSAGARRAPRAPYLPTGKAISQPVSLTFDFAAELGEPAQPYERLLSDALRGDSTHFRRCGSRGCAHAQQPRPTFREHPSGRRGEWPHRRKNELVLALMATRGVEAHESSLRFLAAVSAAGLTRAAVTASENADAILDAAGLAGTGQVDGLVAEERALTGKPTPDAFLEATRRLGFQPGHAGVFEDAVADVAAGRTGGFGWAVGVDSGGEAAAPRASGGDFVVVSDLSQLIISP